LAADNSKMRKGIDKNSIPGQLKWFGHIHKFQEFAPGFAYLGSCTQCGFGEVGEKKYFGIFQISDVDAITYEYREIPQRTMLHIRVREDDANNLYTTEIIPQELKAKGVLLKFVFIGNKEWLQSIDKANFKKKFKNAIKVEIDLQVINTDTNLSVNKKAPMEERVAEYTVLKKKSEYLDTGLEILKMAKEIEV
jgi:DNA repair exonuclease SbcCD nuclease subunit